MHRRNRLEELSVIGVVVAVLSTVLAPRAREDQGKVVPEFTRQVVITVGSTRFVATLHDNATARAFAARLPLSMSMKELNGNEKFAEVSPGLPVEASKPKAIRAGALMLYGADTVVLFYESFATTYAYTPIAQVDDPTGLKTALGPTTVTVTFEAQRQ